MPDTPRYLSIGLLQKYFRKNTVKFCPSCGYKEYSGMQAEVLCPNCEDANFEIYFVKVACKNDSNHARSFLPDIKEKNKCRSSYTR